MDERMIIRVQHEQQRAQDLLREYLRIGPAGAFGASFIQQALDDMEYAIRSDQPQKIHAALERLEVLE